MTLKEMYSHAKANRKPQTPGAVFIHEIASVTKKSEMAVRRWLVDGPSSSLPDALTQEILANHFNTTPQELFPTTK